MNKPTLVVLAAGMASRYGSLKQVDGFGPHQETIIDYSIFDAIRAGFGKVVFVIRHEFEEIMRKNFDNKLRGQIDVAYAYQDYDLSRFGIDRHIERSKPWGTAHAVMCARNEVNGNFCVINADDFYGSDAFEKMGKFLTKEIADTNMSLMGFEVGNTMSDFGYVSRGVCEVDASGNLVSVTERTNIYYSQDSTSSKTIVFEEDGQTYPLAADTRVSMNFWGFTPRIFDISESLFPDFVEQNASNPKAEFFIPTVPDYMVKQGLANFKVIPTSSKWFGVTYKEDKEVVQESIASLIAQGVYPEKLF